MIEADPFDLPEWLGESEVTWTATSGVRAGHRVTGTLSGDGSELACDLLAIDVAYPAPVADDATRSHAHQAWRHGQVLLVEDEGRLTLAAPGTAFTADLALECLDRLAKAVGASADRYTARLRIGGDPGAAARR